MSNYRIHEIRVTTDYKSWNKGINQNQGDSIGSELTWIVKPHADPPETIPPEVLTGERQPPLPPKPTPEHPGWTSSEAKKVVLEVRREQQAVLIIEAQACGVTLPNLGVETIEHLDKAIASFDKNHEPESNK